MLNYILRRLIQAVFTIFGVMIVTFLLFRVAGGDIASAHVGEKATKQDKADWRHLQGYDLPLFLNVHRQLLIIDHTEGDSFLQIEDGKGSAAAGELAMIPSDDDLRVRMGVYVLGLSENTPINKLTAAPDQKKKKPGPKKPAKDEDIPAIMVLKLSNGATFSVNIKGVGTCGELMARINENPKNVDPETEKKLVEAKISDIKISGIFRSQFVDHLYKSVSFQVFSLVHKEKLTKIIRDRAPYSLALTVPAMALTWVLAMIISSVVAYYRGSVVDKMGVFLSVLGMCIPFLAFMIYGQWLMYEIAPKHAYGLDNRANIYIPILIMTIAGIGGSVRFYRTVILDETNRDYVRTALAKGVPLPGVMFKHVLKNCMLPILTNLVLAIPFLIMGSLLVESYFGIPGLGDLLISSISGRDEPILSGMVFLTALILTIGLLVTDLSYVFFDPRVRLR